ncbi:MAG TPA: iron uptake system protein EfeO [Baekduia sp.]|uniref:iron uptake system protein EfeO n=1 Tax=Baekduia sp. TaxID=2600305 RepID=UPI002D78458E|nr:iron uptake system protein EfeO [Baekduia sp.]HET6506493.1 iron uptake system protein EfeO [Baekduia sp.]
MLPTFVIGLREGVEAALIVSIIATFLRQEGRQDALRWVWVGVLSAGAICLAIGVILQIIDEDLPQKQQEGLETIVGAVAVGIVTFMLVWMRKNAAGLGKELREHTASALRDGSVKALIGMAFFAVFREGLETAVFLLAVFQHTDDPATAGTGAILGLLAAIVIGFAIYRGGIKLNLTRFFRFTGLVLALVAAGLVASTLHTAHEAGWINFGQDQALDLTWLVVPGTWTAALLTGMLGLQPQPTTVEVVGYLLYAVPAITYILWPARKKKPAKEGRMKSTVIASTLVIAAALLLAACGSDKSSGSAAGGGSTKQVAVKLTDAGCEPAQMKLDAGRVEFKVTNGGTGRVSEFEVLSGSRILGEKENLVAGLSGSFTVNLEPGEYALSCPGGKTNATGVLTVGGSAVAAAGSDDPLLKSATASYASYVTAQTKVLVSRTQKFVDAVKAGDLEQAKSLFASTRAPYETIEPVAESFGNLDPEIDARVNDVAKGTPWTGFHRIEQGLWVKKTTKGLEPIADKLLVDVKRLQTKTTGLTYQPEELANGANGLLDEVSASKITGEEDRYSHTDLSDFEANVAGSESAFGLLAPALKKSDPALATTIASRFDAVNAALDKLKQGGTFPSYDTVDSAQRKQLSQLVDALAEPLSKVASKLES